MQDTQQPEPPSGIVLGDRHVRMLRLAVIAMGVVLILGFAAVIARIVYLVGRGSDKAPVAAQALAERATVALPAGASVRNLALSGQRLAIHFDAPSGAGIVVIDLATGGVVSRVGLVAMPGQ